MLNKKPAFLLSTSPGLHPFGSSSCQRRKCANRERRLRKPTNILNPLLTIRSFATTYANTSDRFSDDFDRWPKTPLNQKHPTPYQIFGQSRSEPYSKRRFYELVKIYHPDRNYSLHENHGRSKCSTTVRLERYRLIVAANEILSDPIKRRNYDAYGWGWSDDDIIKPKYDTHRRDPDGKGWYRWPIEQNPMYCATWEDWEKFYEQTGQKPSSARQRRALYVNNYAFVTMIALLALLSGTIQSTRINNLTAVRNDRVNLISEQSSQTLMKARDVAKESAGSSEGRQRRLKRFVRDRENYSEDEFDGRTLDKDDPELCSSNAVKDKDEKPFWERPPEIR